MPQAQKQAYSVGAVCRLTGLSAHVLRAWERRYGAVRPHRSGGGTRRYSERDVGRLQLLATAVRAGHRIGDLARLPDREIRRLLDAAADGPRPATRPILDAMANLDSAELERLLALQLAALGPAEFAVGVALPVLEEIGQRWRSGRLCVASEHLGSSVLRLFLGIAMRAGGREVGPLLLFATPAGEHHELGAMIAAVYARSRGVRTCYLGPDLPVDQIVWAVERTGADAVGLGVTALTASKLQDEVARVREKLPESVEVWLGGRGARSVALPPGVHRVVDLDALASRLDLLRAHADEGIRL